MCLAGPAFSYHVCATPWIFIAKSRLGLFLAQPSKVPRLFAEFLLCVLDIRILTVDGLSPDALDRFGDSCGPKPTALALVASGVLWSPNLAYVGPFKKLSNPVPVLCKLRETLELLVNLVLDFTEPFVPAFLVAVAFVVVYVLRHLVEHPSLSGPSGVRKTWPFVESLETGQACLS
jgi:hypothetical protein